MGGRKSARVHHWYTSRDEGRGISSRNSESMHCGDGGDLAIGHGDSSYRRAGAAYARCVHSGGLLIE